MFNVSEEFKTAIKQNTRKYEWYGTITTKGGREYRFDSNDIVKGSGYIKWQCCGDSEIELGTVYAAEMGISLFSEIDRYTLNDANIKIYYSLTLPDGSIETIPMGIFEVSEANRKIKVLELKAYDYMLRFEKSLKLESSSGTPYQFLKVACEECRVEMAQTVAEINALPNGNTPVWVVPQKERYDSSYSDFVTRYTAISSTNQINQTSEYIAMETDDALTMNLGINPLMQFGLKSVREKMLNEILKELQKVNYVPFDSSTIGNPALEPGDIIKFIGGHADDEKISCITSIEYKIYGKQTLKCVGKNPRLAAAKSKNDKNITGLLNSVESGKTIIYNFVNINSFAIGQALTKVIDINFTATEETSAAFQCEMLVEIIKSEEVVEETPELTIIYKINDAPIDNFIPTKTCIYGKHIITLYLPISKVLENSANTFSMYIKVSDGTVNINEAQIRATISGQGLAAGLGDWNGRININDNIGKISVDNGNFVIDNLTDKMEFNILKDKTSQLIESIGNISIAGQAFGINSFVERTWFSEILRTFTLTVVSGKPRYNNYITVNNNEEFILRRHYTLSSEPNSQDLGFIESLTIDTSFLESIGSIEVGSNSKTYRLKKVVDTSDTSVKYSSEIDIANGYFELKGITEDNQKSVSEEIDEGFLESLSINIAAFDGVKGVEIYL